MFSPQIHIVFNCREERRITSPILNNPPNKLYYFIAHIKETDQTDEFLDYYNRNKEIIKKNIPSIKIVSNEVDYTNYIEIVQELSKIIKFERDENPNSQIFINVSSGSKMTSNASIEASKLWNCEPYYAFSSQYDPYGEGELHKGKIFIKKPITFPIKKPEAIYIETLKLIDEMISIKYENKDYNKEKEKFIYLKNLIDNLQEVGIIQLENRNDDIRKQKAAIYMKSRNFLEPLLKSLKYIIISQDKRNKKVFITEKGKDVLEIFKFLI